MAKKVLQVKTGDDWDRAFPRDLRGIVEETNDFIAGMKLRFVVNYLFSMQWVRGADGESIRFDDISKCRERSYKPFTSTSEYFDGVEADMKERGLFPC